MTYKTPDVFAVPALLLTLWCNTYATERQDESDLIVATV